MRFGNVFESSGSVIPIFKKQINLGQPITVTSKNATRFFMSIPEAVILILSAQKIANGNEIFIFEMGKPVKIYDLAHRMINLSGKKIKRQENDTGIEIVETGLREGEKLYEELLIDFDMQSTPNEKILIARENSLTSKEFEKMRSQMIKILETNQDKDVKKFLRAWVKEYLIVLK